MDVEEVACGDCMSTTLPVKIPSILNQTKVPEIHLHLQTQDNQRRDLTDSDELMLLYEANATDINSNTPLIEFTTSRLKLFSTGSTSGFDLSPTSGRSPSGHGRKVYGVGLSSTSGPGSKSESFEAPQSFFFNKYSLNDAFDNLVVNPFRNFHENLRKKLVGLQRITDNQEGETKTDNSEINSDWSDFYVTKSFQTDVYYGNEEVFSTDSEFYTNECIEGTRKRSLCSTPEIGSFKIPKTPWHSPARDADDIVNPIKLLNKGGDGLVIGFPRVSKSCSLTPVKNTRLSSETDSNANHLCQVFAPPWLQWQPKMHAFICDYNQSSTTGYHIDLYLPEPNPDNKCHIVKEEHYQIPAMEEKISVNIPNGMKWVEMSSGSGFLVTTAHLNSLGTRKCLPITWKTYSNSVILSQTKSHNELSRLSVSH